MREVIKETNANPSGTQMSLNRVVERGGGLETGSSMCSSYAGGSGELESAGGGGPLGVGRIIFSLQAPGIMKGRGRGRGEHIATIYDCT